MSKTEGARLLDPPLESAPASLRVTRAEALAWTIWVVLGSMAVISRMDDQPSVMAIYNRAGSSWSAGRDLYGGSTFLYLPISAVLLVPLSMLPVVTGDALFRICNLAVFACGMRHLCLQVAGPGWRTVFLFGSAIAAILSWSAARHGQLTLAMGGFMMLACCELERRRWWRLTLYACLAVALKPLAIVLALIVGALFHDARWRLALGLVLVGVLPFAFQSPDYVLAQCMAFPEMLAGAAARGEDRHFPHALGVLSLAGSDLSVPLETVIRLLFAMVTLLLALFAKNHFQPRGLAFSFFVLTSGYILLFSHGTERNTYGLIAPALGISATLAVSLRRWERAVIPSVTILAFLLSYRLNKAYPDSLLGMLKPISTAAFLTWISLGLATQRSPQGVGAQAEIGSRSTRKLARSPSSVSN